MVVAAHVQPPLPWLEAPLQQALRQQRTHALLVQAADGVGTLEFMLTLAQAWLCEATGEPRPCGRCPSCRLVQSHTHPDLQLLLPEARREALGIGAAPGAEAGDSGKSKRKPSRQIRIDEVRAAIDWVVQSSSRGKAKVIVLHPAEAMNAQAASALLKTLEEPPGQARLLLGTGDAARLLPTVRSRCQRLQLPVPAADQARAWLEEQGVAKADVLLAAAGGHPLEAREMAGMGIDAGSWQQLPRSLARGQAAAMAGWPVPRSLDALQKICHDAMCIAGGGAPRFFDLQAMPPRADLAALSRWMRSLSRVARHDEHPWNEALLIEALVLEGSACWQEGTTREPRRGKPFDTLGR